MKKINKKKIEEFIRVDHAGERGAVKIYEGQLLALNTFIKDDTLKKIIELLYKTERVVRKNTSLYKPIGFIFVLRLKKIMFSA